MTSRRAFVVGGAALLVTGAGVAATGHLDEAIRAVGVDPKPLPDPSQTALLERVRADQGRLVAGAGEATTIRDVLSEQYDVVGGTADEIVGEPFTDLSAQLTAAAERRGDDALAAKSPDLMRVLTSMAAGLAVLAEEAQ